MKKIFLSLMISCIGFTSVSEADVRSKQAGDQYIKVSRDEADSVRFDLCDTSGFDEVCDQIGDRSYTEAELDRIRKKYYAKAAGILTSEVVVGTVVAYASAYYIGGNIASLIISYIDSYTNLSLLVQLRVGIISATGSAGAGVWATAKASTAWLNPMTRYRKGQTVRRAIVSDQEVLTKMSIQEFADTLSGLLAELG